MSAVSPFHPGAGSSPVEELAAVALGLAAAPGRWRHLVQHRPGVRAYVPVTVEGAEAWVITWPPGTGLGLHDHGDAAGALVVVGGCLVERHGVRQMPGHLRTRVLDQGTVVAFDADHVHQVTNEGDVPAISIHVYAPSLDRMTFFGADPRDDLVVQAGAPAGNDGAPGGWA